MTMLTVSCPSCGFSREISSDKLPDGTRRVTCPKCKNSFTYTKPEIPPSATVQPAEPAKPDSPPETPRHLSPDTKPAGRTLRPEQAAPQELTDIGGLFRESWQVFQRRFATLFGLYLLSIVAAVVPIGLFVGLGAVVAGIGGSMSFILIAVLGAMVALACGLWCYGGLLHAVVDDTLCLKDSLAKGKEMILPLAWVSLLTGFIVAGGYILLLIPGIIFTVWFFFAQFVLAGENVRGMEALLKSKEYVRGQWFNVALRLVLVWAASVLVGVVPVVGPILSIAIFPYVIIYHYLVYRDLRRLKGDVIYSCGTRDKLTWPGIALAGWVIVPVILISFVGVSLFGGLSRMAPCGIVKESTDNQGLRVITFPNGGGSVTAPASPAVGDAQESGPSPTTEGPSVPLSDSEQTPESIHVFIYAVNYTGTVRVNGTTIRELEGKPDMQFNYNQDGKGLRYGHNQIEVDFSEIPNPPSTLLGVHLKISRHLPGKEKEILADWKFSDKGTGRKTFDFEIPR